MLSSEFEYKENFGVIRMIVDRDDVPFGKYVAGHFVKTDEDYFVFEPLIHRLNCKQLREAAKKVSELNTQPQTQIDNGRGVMK